MTTITAPLRRSPRTMRTPSAPSTAWARRAMRRVRYLTEGMNSDDRARACDIALRPYSEARSTR